MQARLWVCEVLWPQRVRVRGSEWPEWPSWATWAAAAPTQPPGSGLAAVAIAVVDSNLVLLTLLLCLVSCLRYVCLSSHLPPLPVWRKHFNAIETTAIACRMRAMRRMV